MRRIREVLRLRHQGLTERVIARMLGVSNGVVHGYVRRARLAGLTWPLPEGMDDEGLELLLFPAPTAASQSDRRPAPDWVYVEKELRRRSVTRLLLWEEYRAANPDGFGYTWFCTTFEAWKQRARPSMRQTHIGGEKVFVDFAGDTIDIFNPITGEVRAMKLFVAAMGASNYTYAEACPSESLSDWIGMHTNLFKYLGGVPKFVVCDNLKAAVTNPDRYDPGLNRTYAEMAGHYGTAILAARPRRPKDKTSVSYCTLFWRLRGDGDEPGRAGVAPSAAFEDGLLCGQRPQATIQMVATAFCDQPLTAPLVHGGFRDAKLCSDLACREHATAA
jgi:transposase